MILKAPHREDLQPPLLYVPLSVSPFFLSPSPFIPLLGSQQSSCHNCFLHWSLITHSSFSLLLHFCNSSVISSLPISNHDLFWRTEGLISFLLSTFIFWFNLTNRRSDNLNVDQQVTTMVLKVDLDCCQCYRKVKKVLCRFPRESLIAFSSLHFIYLQINLLQTPICNELKLDWVINFFVG